MHKRFLKNKISQRTLSYCIFTLFLPFFCGVLTACGSDASPASAVHENESEGKRIDTPLPSEEHLRAFDLILDIEGDDFTPVSATSIPQNPYPDLSVPTYVTKVEDTWFIVDCYHDQIIYHDNLSDPLTGWQVLTGEIDKGHTIASDGMVYLADDTEGNRILVFEKKEGVFYHTQTLDAVGNRPHYILYDAPTDTFYVWSSMSGEMFLCRHDPDSPQMYLTEIRKIENLADAYVRSFTIKDSDIYFVSGIPGSSAILRADLSTFAIEETYPVPESMAGMVQLTVAEDTYYLTVSTDITGNQDAATMIRTEDLSQLTEGAYEDVYANFIGGGTPYYITYIDNSYYLTEHRIPGHAVWKFDITESGISNVEAIY